MHKRLLLLALIIICCSPYKTFAQLKFKKDDTWRYHLEVKDSTSTTDVQITDKVMRITITAVNPDGSADAVSILESAKVKRTGIFLNSKDPATYTPDLGSMSCMLLLHHPLAFRIFPNDSIGNPTNAAAIADTVAASLGLQEDMKSLLITNWNALAVELKYLFPAVPEKFKAGYMWRTSHGQYRVGMRQKEVIAIVGRSDDKGEVTYFLYHESGNVMMLKSEKGTRIGFVNVLAPEEEGPAADTAYYHTLVRMSRTSSYLRINKEPDSARVMSFLAENMPRYGDRAAFELARLDVYGFGSEFMSLQYQKALKEVPANLLPPYSSHLINKLQLGVLDNVDSMVAVAKIMTGSPMTLNYWLDDIFAPQLQDIVIDTAATLKLLKQQGVSDAVLEEMLADSRKEPDNNLELLRRLMLEKDSLIQASVRPMFLWTKALHTTDTAILKKIAAAFQQVSTEEMTWGKAARYELLTVGILRKAGMNASADSLLAKTVSDLDANLNDTTFWGVHPELKKRKLANKYLLAHAWFLQYQRTLPHDKKAALHYLALAAGSSPKTNAEKVFESRTDQHMLQAKETYSGRLAQELEALGQPEEAMKVLSKQLLVQPEMLDSTKAYFEAHFPGKSFPRYFREVLLNGWEQAPDFTVTGMNKETIRLADYKGKWLLMDFWGTWCSPCRADLPHLNKLAVEMNAGQHPGNAILAVSCLEPLETARDFVADNKYVFATAHSDGEIEKSYKIRGYPTKVLVSPEGKMLALQFGADYSAILQAYTAMYFRQAPEQMPSVKANNKKD
ncbi:TlpA family protein disulfide reductase [Chitinophaga arvensicola]|uniref:Thiol-disulfide isomerase or thioredoxin n=1 Tax=Chitinophaga arvensicola TaxID=29529 RepID=A0A1I0NED2_9BACT|nr:TlpA disulfide reductase family protein [Chitinophaga arvensicola]SEV99562.1 Thiol-disulfide isomerase or thioredoxin [Chitinophaga arvensicola]